MLALLLLVQDDVKKVVDDAVAQLNAEEVATRDAASAKLQFLLDYPAEAVHRARESSDREVAARAGRLRQSLVDTLDRHLRDLSRRYTAVLEHVPLLNTGKILISTPESRAAELQSQKEELDAFGRLFVVDGLSAQPADPALLAQFELRTGMTVRKVATCLYDVKVHDVILDAGTAVELEKLVHAGATLTVLRKGGKVELKKHE